MYILTLRNNTRIYERPHKMVAVVFEDLKFKNLEGYDQNWSEPSEILNLRSSDTPATVDFTPP